MEKFVYNNIHKDQLIPCKSKLKVNFLLCEIRSPVSPFCCAASALNNIITVILGFKNFKHKLDSEVLKSGFWDRKDRSLNCRSRLAFITSSHHSPKANRKAENWQNMGSFSG